MPRYFFHVDSGQGSGRAGSPDREGTVLSGPEQAREEAIAFAAELLRDLDGAFWNGGDWSMRVADETGATVCTLLLRGRMGDETGEG